MLAIKGGEKVRGYPFPAQETIGNEERRVVERVMSQSVLSHYRGNWTKYFYGGPEIRALEEEFAEMMGVKYAICCNSCTSALIIACGAVGLGRGDKVIVTPWSMTCSATAPMHWGGVPEFADLEYDYFCIDVNDAMRRDINNTKAIIMVDLFGQPGNLTEENRKLFKDNGVYIIEDAAQAIGSTLNGKKAGTLGDIGCYSFTQGKHLTAGEGGMIVTDSPELAMKCRLIMNHAEAVVNAMKDMGDYFIYDTIRHNRNMLGYNMRMTEIQAAILREQIKKLDRFIEMRQKNVEKINSKLEYIDIIEPADTREGATHAYYSHPFYFFGRNRDVFIQAVVAELSGEEGRADRPMFGCGYIKPLYQMPIFNYDLNLPVTERLYKDMFFLSMYHNLPLNDKDIDDIAFAFDKVYKHRREL